MLKQTCPSDNDLAGRIQARDEAAFELLYQRYGDALVRYVTGYLRDEVTAQDLVQETFLRVWTRAEQWSGLGSFKAWLYRIATNLALNQIRAQQRHPAQPLADEDDSDYDEWSEDEGVRAPAWVVDAITQGPDAAFEQMEERARLQQALNRLPDEKREVFQLVHEMELSIRDAAGWLGIPEGTVKSRLHYAQKKLSQVWDETAQAASQDAAPAKEE